MLSPWSSWLLLCSFLLSITWWLLAELDFVAAIFAADSGPPFCVFVVSTSLTALGPHRYLFSCSSAQSSVVRPLKIVEPWLSTASGFGLGKNLGKTDDWQCSSGVKIDVLSSLYLLLGFSKTFKSPHWSWIIITYKLDHCKLIFHHWRLWLP